MWTLPILTACRGVAEIAPVEDTDPATTSADTSPPPAGPPAPLARAPYLQQVTPTSATVVWGVDLDTQAASLRWGASPDTPHEVVATATDLEGLRLMEATLTGLEPDSTVHYAVSVDGRSVVDGLTLRTAPASADASVGFVALGDFGARSDAQLALRDVIAQRAEDIDLWLTTGDNAYGAGRESELQQHVFDVYADLWHRAPVFPALGNHDYTTAFAQPYLDSFVLPRNAWRPEDAERYYSFDWGPLHVVVVDSEASLAAAAAQPAPDDMLAWLDADLSAADRPWTLVLWHKPPYSGHPARPGDPLALAHLVPLMEKHQVPLVLMGHNHFYERMRPIHGVTYVITGGGGQFLYPVEPWEQQQVGLSAYHFVQGRADACSLSLQAVDETGATLDTFTLTRCP